MPLRAPELVAVGGTTTMVAADQSQGSVDALQAIWFTFGSIHFTGSTVIQLAAFSVTVGAVLYRIIRKKKDK